MAEPKYNPKMVRKIRRALKGPFIEVPADPDEFQRWLDDCGTGKQKERDDGAG